MLSKVKAQKTRLSNYLINELGAKRKTSNSTESEYFKLGSLSIRISDHTARSKDEYINIFIPFNDPNSFIIENNYTISILKSLKEVKNFLYCLIFITEQYKEILNLDIHQELAETKSKVDDLIIRNKELEKMVKVRNEAIENLSKRVNIAEAVIFSNPNLTDIIITKGKRYSLNKFPQSFLDKARNIIKANNIEEL